MNPSIEGTQYPSTEPFQVGREHIRQFAAAVGSATLLSTDPVAARSAGFDDLVAPPTFAVVIAQRAERALLSDPSAGIDFAHLVHGDERFEHHRPIVAGDELTASTRVERVRSLAGNSMVTAVTEVRDVAGEAVCTATATFVIRDAVEQTSNQQEAEA